MNGKAEVWPDYIHMLIEIPLKYSVASVIGFLKGNSSLMVYSKSIKRRTTKLINVNGKFRPF